MRLITCFVAILFLTNCQTKVAQTEEKMQSEIFQVQVIPGELPDPSIIEVDGTYYATGSSNDWGPLYPIYKSTDLKNWEFVRYVFDEIPEWTSSSFWAPELFYKDGKFYCYYTAKRKDGVSVIGVASTEYINSGFSDHGQLLEWGNESIDAFVFQENEKLYVSWKAYGLNPDKPIQLLGSELSEDGLQLKGEVFEMLTADADNWERGGIEGQSILEKDGYLYMLYSGNACCGEGCDYMVGLARAKSFTGPWEKYEGNPVLQGNENWKCPGHGTAIRTGEDWYYLYHAYPSAGFPYLGRVPLLSQMFWEDENGWPSFKVESINSVPSSLYGEFSDDFDSEKLGPMWRFDIPNSGFQKSIHDGKLKMSGIENASSDQVISFIGVNPESENFTFTSKVYTNSPSLHGLALYVTKENSVGVGVKNGSIILWNKKAGEMEVLNEVSLEMKEELSLKAEVKDAHLLQIYYSLDEQNWTAIPNSKEGTEQVNADNLKFWSWGIKAGLFVKSDKSGEESFGEFSNFEISYDK